MRALWSSSLAAIMGVCVAVAHAQAADQPSFTTEQAAAGKTVYTAQCERCHGPALEGGQFGPSLKGAPFTAHWQGKKVSEYFTKIAKTMPPGAAGSLDDNAYAAVVAYILQVNGVAAGAALLAADPVKLAAATMPASAVQSATPSDGDPSQAVNVSAATIGAPAVKDVELTHFKPVTDAILGAPPPEDWLIWRRTYDSQGYSPLKQIDDKNVKALGLAWSWALDMGAMETTPIVHDGVMFIQSGADMVEALDAATGDLLWRHVRSGPADAIHGSYGLASVKRNMAIGGTMLFVATVDAHVIALDARTGHLIWDQQVADPSQHWYLSAGPLYVHGKIVQGLSGTTARQPGGSAIVGLDAATGRQLWRFNTVAHPGDPGGDSWNGLPPEKRSGASVWTTGSYDPDLNLVFFGTGNTYDTAPFMAKSAPGANMDLLYTDTSLALNPDTGKLVWYFQHMPNDILDLDWAFERSIITLNNQKLVMTGGKLGLFDALDAATGKYAFSRDMGLQTLVSAVNPATGAKTLSPKVLTNNVPSGLICPGPLGARNWMATSIDIAAKVMYVPMDEACGQDMRTTARPGGDGKFGQLAAIDLQSGKVLWRQRTRGTQTAAALATAGNIVFNATYDRWFRANDARTGKELWKIRLADLANAFPITYVAKGKQYVAIAAGGLKPAIGIRGALTPEIRTPVTSSPVLWVFALNP